MKAEEESQLAYEGQMKVATALKKELVNKKTNLQSLITKREGEKTDETTDLGNNNADLKAETDYKADIKPDCDWIIGAFKEREEKRVAEMNGLKGAKEFL